MRTWSRRTLRSGREGDADDGGEVAEAHVTWTLEIGWPAEARAARASARAFLLVLYTVESHTPSRYTYAPAHRSPRPRLYLYIGMERRGMLSLGGDLASECLQILVSDDDVSIKRFEHGALRVGVQRVV